MRTNSHFSDLDRVVDKLCHGMLDLVELGSSGLQESVDIWCVVDHQLHRNLEPALPFRNAQINQFALTDKVAQ